MPQLRSILQVATLTAACIVQPAWCSASPPDDDLAVIASRLRANAVAAAAVKLPPSPLQDSAGAWPDLDYAHYTGRSSASLHLQRLLKMASTLGDPTHPDDPNTVRNISNGLRFWLAHRPRSSNWWDNEIGQQLVMEQILLLGDGHLPAQTILACTSLLGDPAHPQRDMPTLTGQNLAWIAEQQIVRGVLLKNENDIRNGLQGLQQALQVSTHQEGSQVDGSFHQHGAQMYLGGYGLELVKNGLAIAAAVANTRFALSQATLSNLSDLLLVGLRAVTYRQMVDVGTTGREIARPGTGHLSSELIAPLDNLKAVLPARAVEAEAFKASILSPDATPGFYNHTHFWVSDFTAHHEGHSYVSVKMVSDRTVGTETINGENTRGFWLPFGLTLTSLHGGEYDDVFPLWDWVHLPGVTAPTVDVAFSGLLSQPADFVGGVSDGRYGASGMVVALDTPLSLHARKGWFFFADQVVALGAGISATGREDVDTGIEQANLLGEVLLNGQQATTGTRDLSAGSWVLHHGIGYVLLEPARLHLAIGPRIGAWADINTMQSAARFTRPVFEADFQHGPAPTNGHYAYAIVPGATPQRLQDHIRATSLAILANTPAVQAVAQDANKRAEAIFYQAGKIDLPHGGSLAVNRACMVMLAYQRGEWVLSLASPSNGGAVTVSLQGSRGLRSITLALPDGKNRGRTLSTPIDLPDQVWPQAPL